MHIQDYKEEAISMLADGIKHFPDSPELKYRMAALKFIYGDAQDGMYYLESGLALDFEKHIDIFEYHPALNQYASIIEVIEQYRK